MTARAASHTLVVEQVRGGLIFTETHSYNDAKWGLVTVTSTLRIRAPRRAITQALRSIGYVKASR
jgi:hypothetical protein